MKKTLQSILLLTITLTLVSSSCKEMKGQDDGNPTVLGENFTEATITNKYGADGCGFIVSIEHEGETKLFDPNPVKELNDEFKKEGLKVKIKFHTSRVAQTTCFNTTPIVIDAIKKR